MARSRCSIRATSLTAHLLHWDSERRRAHLDELQADLDTWLRYYNQERPHSGRYCYSKTPMRTWQDTKPLVEEKMLKRQHQQAGHALRRPARSRINRKCQINF
jgi:hypothetical protein